ncbi:two-component system, sensor histidine kinase YesM [Pseudobutyrivibrio sp. ACV-2]|uniref:sensor histidine kinase n=1 Tax=Pseudobutyrivibrio sp. ACV-2 TaxID=1520801 RepID=UPI00089BB762|nr:histidine kinase [Pseudobutyrivibrio sp. ACV-2]SEA82955.1 two-component system, sensor histidine kinase YesM [Pseudobutyrivibrio sp. ACV-2]
MLLKQRKSWGSIKGLKLNRKLTAIILFFVVIPIALLSGVMFYNMEQSTIKENVSYLSSTMARRQDSIKNNIDSINMTTQFFLSDETMNRVLINAKGDGTYTTKEWMQIYHNDVAALERLINTNPVLGGARYYASTDNVQEMMPVMYTASRMQRQQWKNMADEGGWIFDYTDNLFSDSDNTPMMALITPMRNRKYGELGIIEANMKMKTMFPSLYENVPNEISCFVTADDKVIFGGNTDIVVRDIAIALADEMSEVVSTGEMPDIKTYYSKTDKSVISGMYINELSGTLVSVENISGSLNEVYRQRNYFVAWMIVILVLLSFIVDLVVKQVLKNFYQVLYTIRQVRKGDLSVRAPRTSREDEMGELAHQVNRMLDNIQTLMKQNIDREVLAKDSQIKALQNQINAHFIYNVLESIKMMAEMQEEYDISDSITSLGKLLRYSMKWTSETVLVSEELEYIKNYMALINLRFDYDIILSLNLSEEIMSQRIPKMSLQPIIENAIIHGVEEIAEDTTIYIKGLIKDEDYLIEITDNGRGMNDEELDVLKKKISGEITTGGGSGNGIGLKNVQDRLRMAFGETYGIEVATKEGCYTKVSVKIPRRQTVNTI